MGRPKVICHIIHKLDFGGLENGLVNLINAMPSDEYRHVIVSLKPSTDFQKRISQPDVQVVTINKAEGKDLGAYLRLWRLLRSLHPDIVHTRNIPALDMLFPAAMAGVKRLVHSEHGLDITELDGHHVRYNRLRRLSRTVAKRYIAVSRDLQLWLHEGIGIPEEKISLIYNGVDTNRFHPNQTLALDISHEFVMPQLFVLGTVGRLESIKDQVTLARAFVRILELRPALRQTLRLAIVGDGNLRFEVEKILDSAGSRALAWLPGFRNDASYLYPLFDVFVLPSRREGISNTLLEAMASGLPVVATCVGGNPEVVEENVTGFLVEPNDPELMAHALLRYINDATLVTEHGRAARARVEKHFSLDAMVSEYRRVYELL